MELSKSNNVTAESVSVPAWARIGRLLFFIAAWIFLICIVAQIFIAGMAIFSDSDNWSVHVSFVKSFAMVPLVMFLLTFAGRLRGRLRWISLGMFALIIMQFLTVQVFSSVGIIAALHPVIAMLLFWGAVILVKQVTDGYRGTEK